MDTYTTRHLVTPFYVYVLRTLPQMILYTDHQAPGIANHANVS